MLVKFNDDNVAYVTFHKWDYGQILEFENAPQNSEIHFPVKDSDELMPVKIADNKCSIPNSTLTLDENTFDAWMYIDNGAAGITKKKIYFNLIQRAKPDDHIYNSETDKVLSYENIRNILSSGNLIGIEKISSVEDFEQLEKKYEDVPVADNKYMLLFVTEDIYSGEDLIYEEGLIVHTPTDDYKLTCNKELEEFKKAVEMNFNLFFQALGNYATREKLEQVKTDLLRSIELLQSQTEQKISTTNKNVLQLTARVNELDKAWITVCDDTLTEDISFLLKTTDAEGNPFRFKKLKVYIYSPVNEATGNTGVRIINGIDYSDMDNILVQTSNWFMNTLSQHCVATVDCGGFAVTETNRGPTMDKMNNTGIMGVNFNVESITSVLIRPISTTAKMIPGTRIVVKGC